MTSALVAEAQALCDKIDKNLKLEAQLRHKYPANFLQLKYEKVTAEPLTSYRHIYDFLSIGRSRVIDAWIARSVHSKWRTENAFGTMRRNATLTASRWMTRMDGGAKRHITRLYRHVLERLIGHDLVT